MPRCRQRRCGMRHGLYMRRTVPWFSNQVLGSFLGSCSAVGEAGGRRVAACGRAGVILTSPATQPCPRRGQFSKAQDESTRADGLSLSAEISTPQCGGMSRKRSAFVSAETFSHFFVRGNVLRFIPICRVPNYCILHLSLRHSPLPRFLRQASAGHVRSSQML